jgi:glycosyltransferase involved in cell wall biosynthesis
MAPKEEVVFLSFADEPSSYRDGALRVEHIQRSALLKRWSLGTNPFSSALRKLIQWADVIHCHQVHTLNTDLAVILGKNLGRKKVFVTDLGGSDRFALSYHLPLLKRVNAFLLISEYSRLLWARAPMSSRPKNLKVIYGGVDAEKFSLRSGNKSKRALFVGRLLPHKGVDYLVDAIEGHLSLEIVGRAYHKDYFALLRDKSRGKTVSFYTAVDEEELVRKYRESLVTVLPSVYDNCYGNHTEVPELFGLVLLESMACGTPVIATDVASLPEIVEPGVTGLLVPPNDPVAIRQKIEYFYANPNVAVQMGMRGREKVLKEFTWDRVVDRCLAAYRAH